MLKQKLEQLLGEAMNELGFSGSSFSVERHEDTAHGDYASNVALVCAKDAEMAPRALAEKVVAALADKKNPLIARVEIAGPGFINFFLTDAALAAAAASAAKTERLALRSGERINIEFISANPTGDLHIGHGRGAFFGDVLARVLSFVGADVVREFYINDSAESKQIKELGKTALGQGEQYKTPHLEEMIEEMEFAGFGAETVGFELAGRVQAYNRNFIETKLGINFDVWYSEDEKIRATGAADTMLARLKEKNLIYEKDGALWLKTTEYGDDEDRVVVRSNGTKSYFIADIFYHDEKFKRGFSTVIDVWGADHHGHVKRMHAVGKILGWPQDPVQPIIFITQMVSLKEEGESKKMSKRAGNVILLEDLVDELGIDVVRWFFLEKSLSSHMEFDLALAREESAKNPVLYVQYAHARICSIKRSVEGLHSSGRNDIAALARTHQSARTLLRSIAAFPEILGDVSTTYDIHKLPAYALALAHDFSQFYRDVRVIDEGVYHPDALAIVEQTKAILAKTLTFLGISAPQKMERGEG
ncbi:MAG: arginine--tRNA ligase [Minisyncoccota bacterium]